MDYLIRWNIKNQTNLKTAINKFNKKIKQLETLENKQYLPSKLNFEEAKESITTKNELDRFIKSLGKFKNANIYETKSGEKITTWEYRELRKAKKRAETRLQQEYAELTKPISGEKYSPVQMGHKRPREILQSLEKLEKLEEKQGVDFLNFKSYVFKQGKSDYEMRKALIYKENYLKSLEIYKKFDGYDDVMMVLRRFGNPIRFYEFFKNTENINVIDISMISDKTLTQAQFYKWIEDIGINLEEKTVEVVEDNTEIVEIKKPSAKNFNKDYFKRVGSKEYKYSLYSKNGNLVAKSNNKQELINKAFYSKSSNIKGGYIKEN